MKRLPRFVVALSASQALTHLARAMVSLATIWYISGLSHRPTLLVELYVLLELPYLLFLIPSGRWVDGRPRYPVVLLGSAVRVGVMFGFSLWAYHRPLTVTGVMAFLVLSEVVTAILQPAQSAWTTELVAPGQRGNLAAVNHGGQAIADMAGPALGGILYTRGRLGGVVGVAAGLMTGSWTIMAWVGRGREQRSDLSPSLSPPKKRGTGFQFLRHHPGMVMMVAFFAVTNALNNVEAVLVPLLAHRVLHLASWQFGILSLTSGGGALAGSWLAMRVFRGRSVRWAFVSMGVFGSMIIGLGLSHSWAMLGAFYLVLGLSFAVTEVITSTLWQVLVPDAVRGQVMGALSTIARAANPAGYVLAGTLDEWLGIRGGLVAGGLAIILLSMVVVWNRAILGLDEASDRSQEGSIAQS